jgi:hypothetical protein
VPIKLTWQGEITKEKVIGAIVDGVTEFGLTHEREAKRELYPGHGKLTSTLQRSVHAAAPTYQFAIDDVPDGPERSGQGLAVKKIGSSVGVMVGSGMRYARRIEYMYGYIANSHSRVAGQIAGIMNKHASRRGLT